MTAAVGHDPSSQTPRRNAVRKLGELQRQTFCSDGNVFFRPLPRRDAKRIHVDDMFVEVTVVEADAVHVQRGRSQEILDSEGVLGLRLGKSIRGKSLCFSDIFMPYQDEQVSGQRVKPVTTVAMIGPLGSGKTLAATKKLPYEWARARWLNPSLLLFLIVARELGERRCGPSSERSEVQLATSLEKLIGIRSMDLNADEIKNVMEFLRCNKDAEKVLFIVDGKATSCSVICEFLVLLQQLVL